MTLRYAARLMLLCFAVLLFRNAGAHETSTPHAQWWQLWEFEPGIILPLALSAGLYVIGATRMWRAAGVGHGITRAEAAWFAFGWSILVLALLSPIHTIGQFLFSVHMSQHELLMLVAAPTLVLGRPLLAMLAGLPHEISSRLARFSNRRAWHRVWRVLSNPIVAWALHAAALWVWHIPALFNAALENESVHALQHACFLGSALLFWWAVIGVRHAYIGYGAAVLYVFTTALHSGFLGAFLTVATTVFYPSYLKTAPEWGFSAIQDQQLGGLIMWIPAGFIYVFAGVALVAGWLKHSERRAWTPATKKG
jgi:putative membrane protein